MKDLLQTLQGTRSNMKCLLQTLPPFEANGKILDYEVTLTRWKSHSQNYTVRDTKLTVNLTSDRYTATLTARNLVGTSDAAVLTIPACDFPGGCLRAWLPRGLGGTPVRTDAL